MSTRDQLHDLLAHRILLLDGATGTMLQRLDLTEADVRGTRFAEHAGSVRRNYDLLTLTHPATVSAIHEAYLDAGADIIKTNTFNSTAVSQAQYGLAALAYELNVSAARLARAAADRRTQQDPDRPRFVAGVVGPTTRRLSDSPDVIRPASWGLLFDATRAAYREQVRGLMDGGVHLLLLETVVDAMNANAALVAIAEEFDVRSEELPLMISVTLTDDSGRLLSGETLDAFHRSIRLARPFSVGLNCGRGARHMRRVLAELSPLVEGYVSCHPSAGLPDIRGQYEEAPADTAALLLEFAKSGLVNIVGGCCGTTPDHIRATRDALAAVAPRRISGAVRRT